MAAECFRLRACAAPKLSKGHSLALVFVNPGSNKWTIARSGGERFDKVAKSGHAAGHCSRGEGQKSATQITPAKFLVVCDRAYAGGAPMRNNALQSEMIFFGLLLSRF